MADNTIKSNANGTFEVTTEKGSSYQASIRNQGGADVVTVLNDGGPDEPIHTPRVAQALQSTNGAAIEWNGRESKVLSPMTYQEKPTVGAPGNILASVTDHAGRKVYDLTAVKANPSNFRVSIGGTETTVENALRLGFINLDGNGSFSEDLGAQLQHMAPKAPPAAPETWQIKNELKDMVMNQIVGASGLDPHDLMAQALGNGESAAKRLCDAIPGQDPRELQEILVGTARSHLEDVATVLEAKGLVAAGEGKAAADFAFDTCAEKVAKRLIHGTLVGAPSVYREIAHRFKTGDRF